MVDVAAIAAISFFSYLHQITVREAIEWIMVVVLGRLSLDAIAKFTIARFLPSPFGGVLPPAAPPPAPPSSGSPVTPSIGASVSPASLAASAATLPTRAAPTQAMSLARAPQSIVALPFMVIADMLRRGFGTRIVADERHTNPA